MHVFLFLKSLFLHIFYKVYKFFNIKLIISNNISKLRSPIQVKSDDHLSRLDNFWKNQDIIYDYQSDIYGTGNRSEIAVR